MGVISVYLVLIAIWIVYRIIVIKKNKNFNKIRELAVSIFFIYFLAVLGVTLFKGVEIKVSINSYLNANLIPIKETLKMFQDNPLRLALYNVVGNIILFVPFGLFIPLLFSKCNKILKVVFYGFIFSLIIETLQLFTKFNATDVDDIIFNTFGAFIGILVCRVIFKIVKHKKVLNISEKITNDSEKNLIKLSIKPIGSMLVVLIIIGFGKFYLGTYSSSLTDKEMAKKVFIHNEGNMDSLITKNLGDYKFFLKDSGNYLDVSSVKKVFLNRYNNENGIVGVCKNINGRYKVECLSDWYENKASEQKEILIVFGKNDKAKNLNVKFKKYNFTENLKENEAFIFVYEINEEKEENNLYEDIRRLNEGITPKYLNIEFLGENGALCENIKYDRYISSDE